MKSPKSKKRRYTFGAIVLVAIAAVIWYANSGPRSGHVLDEAKTANRAASSFPAADEDYFHDMDGGMQLSADEIKGRNMWLVWTGGNDRFWDQFNRLSFGHFDLLKVLSSYPALKFSRDSRWHYFGLLNEPCFTKATAPDPDKYGLWLDNRDPACPADPFADAQKYPGVKIGARGTTVPVGSYYGQPSGIVGLRLFPNPDFDDAAKKAWDPVRFYTDPSYYDNKDLVRPYRVGMSCGFCHVGPNPVRPPADSEHPQWANMSSVVGAQYFWVDRIFDWRARPDDFVFQLIHTARPGALDTSLVSTDYMNNPRTMNAIYELGARLGVALDRGKEKLAGGNLDSKQFNDYVSSGPLSKFFEKPATVWTPRVGKDGSDSIGVLAALNRVYFNIGLFSEEWLLHFNAVVGGKPISPMRVSIAQKNSSYWQATEQQTPAMAQFLLKAGVRHRLAEAPGGAQYETADAATIERGKFVFAVRCAQCHSSKYPQPPAASDPAQCTSSNYLECWNRYWSWTKTVEFKTAMLQIADKPDFLNGNFLSNDLRVPVSLLQTNLCASLATNAIKGHVWADFSSQTYKDLPSVGKVTVNNPLTGTPEDFNMPASGRGYERVPSLVSLWSSAPFLLNNSVGRFEDEPSVAARMRSFDDSIRKILWPQKRVRDQVLGDKLPGSIDRLTQASYLRLPVGYLPGPAQYVIGPLAWMMPSVFTNGAHQNAFTGTTTLGSTSIEQVVVSSAPISTFVAGAPVSGPGIAAGTRVVAFDAARAVLILDRAATASAEGVALSTDTPDAGVRIGPFPAGMPVNLLSGMEMAPESGGLFETAWRYIELAGVGSNLLADMERMNGAGSAGEHESTVVDLQNQLASMAKCPDYVVNRGHYFGTDQFAEDRALSDIEKEDLIAFLKTL